MENPYSERVQQRRRRDSELSRRVASGRCCAVANFAPILQACAGGLSRVARRSGLLSSTAWTRATAACTITRRIGMARRARNYWLFRRNHRTGEVSLDPLRWGLIPHFCEDPKGGRTPINAKCETVGTLPTFRNAYRRRRCILPVDGFFEWKAIKGQKAKQPYAIAMKDGYPFGLGGV